ncbi:hypothetical protein I5602_003521 [Salmonella enterica]|nr:hypothetical protein [Salmonella enterica]EKB3331535.1 hypothetical protein [Salmonella enterica subsp. enterica serovar Chandans]
MKNINSIPTSSEKAQTITALNNGIRSAIAGGLVSNRSDIIRQLCRGGFDIVAVTDGDVTICLPGEPESGLTLSGYIYTRDFNLQFPGGVNSTTAEDRILFRQKKSGSAPRRRFYDSRKIARGIMLTGSHSLAIWGLVSCLMWWLCGHGALTAQVVTPPVAEVMAQVSGVLSLSIMPVCVLLFLMECARVWREKRQSRRSVQKRG